MNFDESLNAMLRRARFRATQRRLATSPERARAALRAEKAVAGRKYGEQLLARLGSAQGRTEPIIACANGQCTRTHLDLGRLVFAPNSWSPETWKQAMRRG